MKKQLLSWIFIAAAVIASLIVYADMPEQMAIHWNARNEVDNYAHKAVALFLLPGLMLLLSLMFYFLPRFDLRKQNYKKFESSIAVVQNVVFLGLLVIHGVTISYGYGYELNISAVVLPIVGVIFIALGNYMPRFQPNSYFGIKNIHTLSNEVVWKKTHQASAKFYVIGGILMIGTAFLPSPFQTIIFLAITVIVVLSSVYMSLYYAKQLKQ